jgi:ThiF family
MLTEVDISLGDRDLLWPHLFQDDRDEHAAILLAGRHRLPGRERLLVREVHLLGPEEFVPGRHGYRQLSASVLARLGNRAASEGLALISCHSHPGATRIVGLSPDDLAGHRRVFPHLLDIVDGQPVVGIAFGSESAAGEVWHPGQEPTRLDGVRVIGTDLRALRESPAKELVSEERRFDRQARMFGADGQAELRGMSVAVIGLGGGGSLICEQLAHLGVGAITAIDFDVVKEHNLSRIVGATSEDPAKGVKKVEVARRLAARIDPTIRFEALDGDISERHVAEQLMAVDFIFLATDTTTSRHVANAIVHSHLIPMIQIGAKIDLRETKEIESVYVAVRPVYPGRGCLHCAQLIDPYELQREEASAEEREAQNYLGLPETIDPSVITLNGIAASVATNTMLMSAVGLAERTLLDYRLFDARFGTWLTLQERKDGECPWCSTSEGSRYGIGDDARLPLKLTPPEPSRQRQREPHRQGGLRRGLARLFRRA